MNELIVAFGLLLFIEGLLYALFPSKMKTMLIKIQTIDDNKLKTGGLVSAIIGIVIIYITKY